MNGSRPPLVGCRSGWAAGPAEFCSKLLPVSETMLFGVQPFIADMTAMALSREFPMAPTMRANYRRRALIAEQAFAGNNLVKPMLPEGGMFILLDVSATGLSGLEFAWELLRRENVAVMPGGSFGQQANGFLRVSLTVPEDVLVTAMTRIGDLAYRLVENSEKRAIA